MRCVDAAVVPPPGSARSTSATLSPRIAASRATPAPVTPPPITITSRVSATRYSSKSRINGLVEDLDGFGRVAGRRRGRRPELEPHGDVRPRGNRLSVLTARVAAAGPGAGDDGRARDRGREA